MNEKFDNLLETTPYVIFDLRSEIEVPEFPSFVFQGVHTKMYSSFTEALVGRLFIFSNGEIFIEFWLGNGSNLVHQIFLLYSSDSQITLRSNNFSIENTDLICKLYLSEKSKLEIECNPISSNSSKVVWPRKFGYKLESWNLTIGQSRIEEILSYLSTQVELREKFHQNLETLNSLLCEYNTSIA